MTFTYTQPIAGQFPTLKDEIRFLIQDTVENEFSISDEELVYFLDQNDSLVYVSASQAAHTLSVKYGKEAAITSRNVGDLSISTQYAETANWYKALSAKLKLGRYDSFAPVYFVPAPRQFAIGQFDELRP